MEKQDFMPALTELTLPSDDHQDLLSLGDTGDGKSERLSRRDPSSEALRVAALHDFFGHKSASKCFTAAVLVGQILQRRRGHGGRVIVELAVVNPRRACAARVTVLGLSVSQSVYDYSCTTGNEAVNERYQQLQCQQVLEKETKRFF